MNARIHQRGLSLIELMVAMLIGVVLISGAAKVYVDSKAAYNANDSTSRLQENARYAMSVIEPDIRMANYWGLLKGAAVIGNQGVQTTIAALSPVATSAAMNICGRNFATDVTTTLQGDNNQYVISTASKQAGCDALLDLSTAVAWNTSAVATADTLTVRRASVFDAAAPAAGQQLQVCSSRIAGSLINDGTCPNAVFGQPDNLVAQRRQNLIVDTFYVDRNSQQQNGLPSLRRKTLTSVGGVMQFRDQEVMAGVEDMQVQFGIDTLGNTGVAQRYVNPDGVPLGAQIVSVRIWLMVRAEAPENNFYDSRIYQYGDRLQATGVTGNLNTVADAGKAYQPSLSADTTYATGPARVRRLLISRTIQVRNAMGT